MTKYRRKSHEVEAEQWLGAQQDKAPRPDIVRDVKTDEAFLKTPLGILPLHHGDWIVTETRKMLSVPFTGGALSKGDEIDISQRKESEEANVRIYSPSDFLYYFEPVEE